MADDIRELPGLVASVCISRSVTPEFSINLANLRSYNDRNGFHAVEYKIFDSKLVEEGRDEVCRHALENNYSWLVQIDGDAAPFPRDSIERMLRTSFVERPEIDVLGGYAQLSAPPYLPTIDTGTGRWEPIAPGGGIVPVIRTGGHFLFLKTSVLRRFGPPWFRTRKAVTPLRAMKELDTFARTKLDGRNPLAEESAWQTLLSEAKQSEPREESHIGEDSGFCDRAVSAGARIFVDTDLVVGHVGKQIIGPEDLKEKLWENVERRFNFVGVRDYI